MGRISLPVLIPFAFAASLALIGSAHTQRSARLRKPPEREKPEIARDRSEWFYSQRAYPHKYVPAGARLNALRELDLMTASELALGLAPTSNPSWTAIPVLSRQALRKGESGRRLQLEVVGRL